MASGDFPTTVNGRVVGRVIGEGGPCNISKDMVGLHDLGDTFGKSVSDYIKDGDVVSVGISGEDYRKTLFGDASISLAEERPVTIINPDTEITLACIQQIAIWNGKCPKKVSNGETDDVYCPCTDFLQHGKCSFGLFVEK